MNWKGVSEHLGSNAMKEETSRKIMADDDDDEGSNTYGGILREFRNELDILRELNHRLADSIESMRQDTLKSINEKIKSLDKEAKREFDESVALINSEVPMKKMVSIKGKPAEILWEIYHESSLIPNRFLMFIRDTGLIYLIAQYENFLRNVLELTFSKQPKIISTCKKSITFEELVKFENLDAVKEEILSKEESEITNQDIQDIAEYFQTKLNINMSEFSEWKKFKERFYRRNVLIHNSGIPNALYRKKTGLTNEKKQLMVSKEYLDESIMMFEEVASKLTNDLKEKVKP